MPAMQFPPAFPGQPAVCGVLLLVPPFPSDDLRCRCHPLSSPACHKCPRWACPPCPLCRASLPLPSLPWLAVRGNQSLLYLICVFHSFLQFLYYLTSTYWSYLFLLPICFFFFFFILLISLCQLSLLSVCSHRNTYLFFSCTTLHDDAACSRNARSSHPWCYSSGYVTYLVQQWILCSMKLFDFTHVVSNI